MSPRGSKRHPVSPADARAYLAKASAWLQAARQLSQLLRCKTPAQYDPAPMPEGDATKAVALARRLVDRAAQVNARRRPSS